MVEMKQYRAYVRIYLGLVGLMVAAIASVNAIVDPFKLFRVLTVSGLNQHKYFLDQTGLRRIKALDLTQGRYDTVILGTSRALAALDPAAPVFGDRQAYNAGLTATNFYEVYQVYAYSRQTLNLRTVVIGLDFFTFSDKRTVSKDFNQSRFAGVTFPDPNAYLTDLLSLDTLQYSLKTVVRNLRGRSPSYTEAGFRNMNTSHLDQYQLFQTVTRSFFGEEIYGGFAYSQERLNLFRQLVEDCKKNNIELRVFITPSHAREMETIRVLGLFPRFEQWKRDLVNILTTSNQHYPNTSAFELWDFSGYNLVTTEAIPPRQSRERMKWYWEASHYRKELGDIVLNRIWGRKTGIPEALTEFGVLLTPRNLEAHLANIRHAQQQYRVKFPADVRQVEEIAQKAMPGLVLPAQKQAAQAGN